MQAPSLLFSLLLGALLIGLCMSRPPKVHQQRHQLRQSGNCSEGSYICNDGRCIPDFCKCNKWIDCIGGEDEVGCACDPLDFKCNDGICILPEMECDGNLMCLGGEDEADCGCLSDEFTCNDGTCIPGSFKCDTWTDCSGGEDEIGCDIFGGSKRATKTGRNKMMQKVKSRPSKKALRK
ncbi:low-density lipoprotein receptor 1-like [Acanthaster planci]|uniref:Low-density lipoprotein receptor 1-like n=1 Tax=Acanthaster planci TaxID=133434 RepID=A0A8B8A040_ACAPL|nr:low-density lipoprotein receptor 1-like [Acanthaster planci]XP_022111039.1 low-density lipoprotein receptor 1-like [Acanthaster planci]